MVRVALGLAAVLAVAAGLQKRPATTSSLAVRGGAGGV